MSPKTSWKTQDKDKEGMKNFSVLHPQLGGPKKLGGGSNVDLYTRDSNKFLPGSFLELNCLSQLQDANRAVQICGNSSSVHVKCLSTNDFFQGPIIGHLGL